MSGSAIQDPVTNWTRNTFGSFIPGGSKYHDTLSSLVFEGPGDIAELGAIGKVAKATAVDPGSPPSLTDTPNPTNSASQLAVAEADQRRARGRAATILTSGSGVSGTPLTAKQQLLGV